MPSGTDRRERFIDCGDAVIHAVEDGPVSAPALVLLSGARCTTHMWEPVLEPLAARFHVIRHDIRGSGRSRAGKGVAFGLDRYADDLAAVMDALGIDRAVIWAMAFGSRVALAFAWHYAQRVDGLALYDASVERPDPKQQREGAARAARRRAELGVAGIARNPAWFAHEDPDTATRGIQAAFERVDHDRYVVDHPFPVLLATGDCDANLPATKRLATRMPGAQLTVLEAVGHGSVLQRPDICLETFLDFVDRRLPLGTHGG